jgi:hypothetical protein
MLLTDITSIAKTTMVSRKKQHRSSKTTASVAESGADVANKKTLPTKEVEAKEESITYLEGPPLSETASY